jgi:hypothetical protein
MEKQSSQNDNPKITEEELKERFLKTLSKKEYQGYEIAKSHLGTSFQLEKSVSYLKWKKDNSF